MNRARPILATLVVTGLLTAASPAPDGAGAGPPLVDESPLTLTLTLTLTVAAGASAAAYAAEATPGHHEYRRTLAPAQVRARFGASKRTVARVSAAARRAGFTVLDLDATGTRLRVQAPARTVQAALGVTVHRTVRHGTAVRAATAETRAPWATGDVQAVSGLNQYVARPLHVATTPAAQTPCTCPVSRHGRPAAPGDGPAPAGSVPHRGDVTLGPVVDECAASGAGTDAVTAAEGRGCARYWGQVNNTAVPQKYPPGRQGNLLCGYTGAQLRALYGLGATDTGAGQTIVIVGAYHDPNVLPDANRTFAATGVPPLPDDRFTVKTYAVGGTADCDTDAWHLEQALDVQTVHTLAPAARIVYVAAPDCIQLEETLAALVADASLGATVVSNSWGILGEPADPGDLAATNAMLSRAAILGTGMYFATGDTGDNSDALGSSGRASVVFPASSPWATAVGGTSTTIGANNQMVWQTGWADAGNTLTDDEWQRLNPPLVGGAGGGASAMFTMPTWQQPVPGTRRAVPDLAALADPFTGFAVGATIDGQYQLAAVGGTSLATPIVASLVALAQAKAGGDADVGFLALLLYAHHAAGRSTTVDVRAAQAGIFTPTVSAEQQVGDYLLDVNAGVQSLTTTPGYDRLTGVGAPGPAFLRDVVS